jgi:hypothetical protein
LGLILKSDTQIQVAIGKHRTTVAIPITHPGRLGLTDIHPYAFIT